MIISQAQTALSERIFSQVKTALILHMRFLEMAIFRLQPEPADITLATDGEHLYYRPAWLLRRYKNESTAVIRDYLHVLLHCIFRHMFVHPQVDHDLWNLACDMAVEAMICDFGLSQAATADEDQKKAVLSRLQGMVRPFTAEKLYRFFHTRRPDAAWAELFRADVHDLWYNPQAKTGGESGSQLSGSGSGKEAGRKETEGDNSPDSPAGNPEENETKSDSGTESGDAAGNRSEFDRSGGNRTVSREQLEQEWRDISEHVQMDLETFARQQGTEAGNMLQLLGELNRERYDYEAFLKKFATLGEVMKINEDEFDYIFYTYGLNLFGNMPLIEPLEYKEVRRVREFVIAIDTSGSTSGELVTRFLTKTYNILMSTESFFSKVNIHILQCDARIQEAVKITNAAAFEDYIKQMTIRGLGGTDFRPVFAYVDRKIREHEFQHLKGLIYFTDGYGTFPEQRPAVKTAFVFVQEQYSNVNVPGWAMKVILEKEEV